MSVPFYEVERYALYISDNKRFAIHQGVKGLEFPRVMVILDDAQAKGFLFSYEKLFGAKAKSDTDVKMNVMVKIRALQEQHVFFILLVQVQRTV